MNLINDPWIPVRTRDGVATISPSEIVRPDVVALAFPRADLNGAVQEWLIGLVTIAAAPADEKTWRASWSKRPTADDLHELLTPLPPAFYLEIFAQDQTLNCEPTQIDQLLVDSEGESTAANGLDLMTRVGQIGALSPSMAAAALITLQTMAPEGGSGPDESGKRVGFYASVRGGGALSTTVQVGDDLWGSIWPNVETIEQLSDRGTVTNPIDALPWMTSSAADITPENSHPATVYFATPRRVQLIVRQNTQRLACSISGEIPEQIITEYRRLPGGRRFAGWSHPLSPMIIGKERTSPRRARASRIGMRDYVGLIANDATGKSRPAQAVAHYRVHRLQAGSAHLSARGFVVNQAAVSGWQSGGAPIILGDADVRDEVDRVTNQLVSSTKRAAGVLTDEIASCNGRVRGEIDRLWAVLEPEFRSALTGIPRCDFDADDPSIDIRLAWRESMRRHATDILRGACPVSGQTIEAAANARRNLSLMFAGYGPGGKALCKALSIPTPKKTGKSNAA